MNDFQPQAIDEYGMTFVNNTSTKTDDKLADFTFTITKTDDLIFLKSVKGTAWSELKFSLLDPQTHRQQVSRLLSH